MADKNNKRQSFFGCRGTHFVSQGDSNEGRRGCLKGTVWPGEESTNTFSNSAHKPVPAASEKQERARWHAKPHLGHSVRFSQKSFSNTKKRLAGKGVARGLSRGFWPRGRNGQRRRQQTQQKKRRKPLLEYGASGGATLVSPRKTARKEHDRGRLPRVPFAHSYVRYLPRAW